MSGKTWISAILMMAVLCLSACGGSGDTTESPAQNGTQPSTQVQESAPAAASDRNGEEDDRNGQLPADRTEAIHDDSRDSADADHHESRDSGEKADGARTDDSETPGSAGGSQDNDAPKADDPASADDPDREEETGVDYLNPGEPQNEEEIDNAEVNFNDL